MTNVVEMLAWVRQSILDTVPGIDMPEEGCTSIRQGFDLFDMASALDLQRNVLHYIFNFIQSGEIYDPSAFRLLCISHEDPHQCVVFIRVYRLLV